MQSSGLSLFPIYTDGHQNGAIEPDAFMASLSLSVILRDITKAGLLHSAIILEMVKVFPDPVTPSNV